MKVEMINFTGFETNNIWDSYYSGVRVKPLDININQITSIKFREQQFYKLVEETVGRKFLNFTVCKSVERKAIKTKMFKYADVVMSDGGKFQVRHKVGQSLATKI